MGTMPAGHPTIAIQRSSGTSCVSYDFAAGNPRVTSISAALANSARRSTASTGAGYRQSVDAKQKGRLSGALCSEDCFAHQSTQWGLCVPLPEGQDEPEED